MKIIIALGNPGKEYEKTRHNVGFLFFDFLLGENISWEYNKKFNADVYFKDNTYFIKPRTFMNNSGVSLRAFMDYYKLLPKKMGLFSVKDLDLSEVLTVVHDDLDIDFGKHKVSLNSSSAGHNGVQSIINHLKTKNFKRIRIGIKNEFKKNIPAEKFVLQRFSGEESEELDNVFKSIKL
ncbi:aminoacyl-tRNA hydrolase [Candidatus Falkowbacteria bacterium HGW-Falkowbacteria-1]|jgi:PTH1 family peptidyl-tRNA hydrolase|uniref:Peptidyl-tRNA hydrolase n=1 Tax=Candidatus Falkowbacteria bacterium HGW-Falkowbacteria-1 TaxID=2013768 RepID=A0A2N2EA18_9BACT|nr:MAG: aminoacyl-tRNA hydrolase [Candidatus Falkowbacteria bacterium HGW-Falkowbacteria-1]